MNNIDWEKIGVDIGSDLELDEFQPESVISDGRDDNVIRVQLLSLDEKTLDRQTKVASFWRPAYLV
jgi:hypothetical protein